VLPKWPSLCGIYNIPDFLPSHQSLDKAGGIKPRRLPLYVVLMLVTTPTLATVLAIIRSPDVSDNTNIGDGT